MRNYYLLEAALRVHSISSLERGIQNLNAILVNRDEDRDCFLGNDTIWEYDTTQGKIYEMFGGIVNDELRRVIPFVFSSFISQKSIYNTSAHMDADFPNDCNGFAGFDFERTTIENARQVFDLPTYTMFVNNCLRYGIIRNEDEMKENLLALFPRFVFEERAVKETLNWKNTNLGLYTRLFHLFDDIPNNPFTGGIGETEVLRHMKGVASKRINLAHRVTYRLSGIEIKILACSGHYD